MTNLKVPSLYKHSTQKPGIILVLSSLRMELVRYPETLYHSYNIMPCHNPKQLQYQDL